MGVEVTEIFRSVLEDHAQEFIISDHGNIDTDQFFIGDPDPEEALEKCNQDLSEKAGPRTNEKKFSKLFQNKLKHSDANSLYAARNIIEY